MDDQHFSLRTGLWFTPTVHDVPFEALSQIDIVSEKRTGRGGEREEYYLLCHRKTGGAEKVPVGDLMGQGAAAKILETAKRRGVPIVDRT